MDKTQGRDEFLGFGGGDVSRSEAEGTGGVIYCNEVFPLLNSKRLVLIYPQPNCLALGLRKKHLDQYEQ